MDTQTLNRYLSLFHNRSLPQLTLSRLLQKLGSLGNIDMICEEELLQYGLLPPQITILRQAGSKSAETQAIEKDLDWESASHNRILCYEEAQYPSLLREIDCPPPILYVCGDVAALSEINIAIVGSRKASRQGKQNAYWIAYELAEAGLHVCSGLARGIDAQAHRGALAAGGKTLAILGTGPDNFYPRSNVQLAEEIVGNGAVVSEFALGTAPMPYNFSRRNRIISGLSVGTVVVEATAKSGSLITARLALEQNREVFALPGRSPTNNPGAATG